VPAGEPRNLGVIGEFGTEAAADALGRADVILVIGSTWWQPKYVPDARFVQVDTRPEHIGMTFPSDVQLVGDSGNVVSALVAALDDEPKKEWFTSETSTTMGRVDSLNGNLPLAMDRDGLDPRRVISELAKYVARDAIVTLDVGDHKYWFTSRFPAHSQQVLLSGHWRSMGFGLPAAIAAQLAEPKKQVVALVGDGGLAMMMAEFTTAVRHKLPIKVLVFNNGVLGEEATKQLQLGTEPFGAPLPELDYALFARACGGTGLSIREESEFQLLDRAFQDRSPCIVDIAVKPLVPSYPRGRGGLTAWQPSLSPRDIRRVRTRVCN